MFRNPGTPNIIAIHDPTVLTSQAALHKGVADHTYQTIGQHEYYHDEFVAATTAVVPTNLATEGGPTSPEMLELQLQLRTMGPSYTAWWTQFRPHLVTYADTHQGLAGHLDGAVENHNAIDAHALYMFTGGSSPG